MVGWLLAIGVAIGCRDVLGIDDPTVVDCKVPTSYGLATAGQPSAQRTGSGSDEVIYSSAYLDASATPDILEIDLLGNTGVFAGRPPSTGMYDLGGVQTDLTTCSVCVLLLADLHFDAAGSGTYSATYLATAGTLGIDALDTRFSAGLSDATFVRVDLGSDDTSTPTSDGCTTAIDHIALAAPLAP